MALLSGMAKLGLSFVVGARIRVFASLGATLFFFVFLIWKLWADEIEVSAIVSPTVLA